jgi:hypothetical protein
MGNLHPVHLNCGSKVRQLKRLLAEKAMEVDLLTAQK